MNKIAFAILAILFMATYGIRMRVDPMAERPSIPAITEECKKACSDNVYETLNQKEITDLGYEVESFVGGVCTVYCYGDRLNYPPLYEKIRNRGKFFLGLT